MKSQCRPMYKMYSTAAVIYTHCLQPYSSCASGQLYIPGAKSRWWRHERLAVRPTLEAGNYLFHANKPECSATQNRNELISVYKNRYFRYIENKSKFEMPSGLENEPLFFTKV